MNTELQALEIKVENQGKNPQGRISAAEWNTLVEAVKALDREGVDEDALRELFDNYYATLSTAQSITGEKDFVNGIKIGSVLIRYNAEQNALVFPTNAIFEGDIAWNSSDAPFDSYSVTKALNLDPFTLKINEAGQLEVIGGGSGSGGGITEEQLVNYVTVALEGYLPKTGGTLSGDISSRSFVSGTDNLGVFIEGRSEKGIRIQYYKGEGSGASYDMLLMSDGEMQWNKQPVIHSGNVANYALPKSYGMATNSIGVSRVDGINPVFVFQNLGGYHYMEANQTGELLWDDKPLLHAGNYSDYALSISGGTVNGDITAQKFIGALEGNADSATKLATPRKIWGQDFDGSANIIDPARMSFLHFLSTDGKETVGYVGRASATSNNIYLAATDASANIIFAIGANENVRITPNGFVGIGTTSPTEKLEVNGNVKATSFIGDSLTLGGKAITYDSTVDEFVFPADLNTNSIFASAVKSYNVCIECDDYGYDRDYKYSINVFNNTLYLQNYGGDLNLCANGGTMTVGGESVFNDTVSITDSLMIGDDGTPAEALEVYGNAIVHGEISWDSSRVLKNIIGDKPTFLTLEQLKAIKPYRFKWKDGRDDKIHAGGIADEVLPVLPEVIGTMPTGTYTMDYGVTAFNVATSLTPYVSEHERRIAELENENRLLRKEVEQLKRVS